MPNVSSLRKLEKTSGHLAVCFLFFIFPYHSNARARALGTQKLLSPIGEPTNVDVNCERPLTRHYGGLTFVTFNDVYLANIYLFISTFHSQLNIMSTYAT